MHESVLVKLLNAYKEEGYEVSEGLNPLSPGWLKESPNGPFAWLVKSSIIRSLSVSPDTDYSVYEMYLKKDGKVEKISSEKKLIIIIKKIIDKIKLKYRNVSIQPIKAPYLHTGGGISLQEIYFFENLLKAFRPKTDFLIGIGSGWSTIAFGLINPSAALYGIDNLSEGTQAREGLGMTQRIAQKLSINLTICVGSSPDDVPEFLDSVGERFDFVFIDGLHTNEQVFLDFKCILPYVSDSVIIAFHDVLNWNMLEGWKKIIDVASKDNFKFKHAILRRTTSGIGILFRNINSDTEEIIKAFYQHPSFPCPT
ncbi:class I SAM-dependent methyltransferase [candidate division WWE3 bacterium]|jgi:predicted O-methyltransferase YrrM|uniref:Class I SAM-dependent methyltransferase n=1 Tax=candidate division WWE3 bacterium TaxID=2053526 RepID=A0A3A4ZL24_UNCKA|nr:MAG: class I SAM-dependent methyltransferase [candidate division WWE3 bacterium]